MTDPRGEAPGKDGRESSNSESNNAAAQERQPSDQGRVNPVRLPQAGTTPVAAAPGEKHSEVPCARCGGQCVEFTVPNDVWNAVVRLGGKEREDEYLCEACYRRAVEVFVRSATPAIQERVAVLMAHRATHAAEHDPINGKIHGYCIVCGIPWPCNYAAPDKTASDKGQG
jgi:hypothetical protein